MVSLLDVNALIALVDRDHVHHAPMQAWFAKNQRAGWATCPLTENGMIRVLSQPAYPSGQRTPLEVATVLSALKDAFATAHHFWPADISLCDEAIFNMPLVAGARQVTDVYLLGLAAQHNARLLSFDRRLAWGGVRGGTRKLFAHPA